MWMSLAGLLCLLLLWLVSIILTHGSGLSSHTKHLNPTCHDQTVDAKAFQGTLKTV